MLEETPRWLADRQEHAPSSAQWDRLIQGALAGIGLSLAVQPIVDLRRGVVAGYEALVRFEGAVLTPDAWLAAARARGVAARLDAAILDRALALRGDLPPDCFLSLNLEPDSLAHPALGARLRAEGRLDGIVLELTEHVALGGTDEVEAHVDLLRRLGAVVAIDDAGAGYAGLQQILRLRPGILKLDRSLVAGIDTDEVKRSLVEMLGVFADRIDAWILAEGVERAEEASVLQGLGVPLAQGYFFARPGPPWPVLSPDAQGHLGRSCPVGGDAPDASLRGIVSRSPTVGLDGLDRAATMLGGDERLSFLVVLDSQDRAVGVVDRDSALAGGMRVPLSVHVASSVVDVARRMLHRDEPERFAPVVCHDESGRYLGTVRAERLVSSLADQVAAGAPQAAPGAPS